MRTLGIDLAVAAAHKAIVVDANGKFVTHRFPCGPFSAFKLASILGDVAGQQVPRYGFLARISPESARYGGSQVFEATDVRMEYLPDATAPGKSV